MIHQRKTKVVCPICKKGKLTAIEVLKGYVSSYRCDKCPAHFSAEIFHDWEHQRHFWIGKHRNPKFWEISNNSFGEGILIMAEKEKQGIPEYLGWYLIEELKGGTK